MDEAISEFRETIRLKPESVQAHNNLGNALGQKGALDEAIAEFREAIRLKPESVEAHNNLGAALGQKGALDEAIAEFREAIRLKPGYAEFHYNLGKVLDHKGALDDAIAQYKEAILLNPEHAEAHCNLGLVQQRRGLFVEALASLRRGHEIGSKKLRWRYPSAQWLRNAEQLVQLDERLPAILSGQSQPAGATERLSFAPFCLVHKHLNAAAARLYREAIEIEPTIADDLKAGHRYNAACAAALAGSAKGADADQLDDKQRADWRNQAHTWLRADLSEWTNQLEANTPQARTTAQKQLEHWQRDPDLAGVRDDVGMAKLNEQERQEWVRLWADVDALLTNLRSESSPAETENKQSPAGR
jgi:Tfp pilus assembly protein PilF